MAVKALSERPATWQALMILGGSLLVEWLRTGDPRLVSGRDAWEVPLRASMDLAPGKDEPQRLLAAGYIGIWPNLTFQERRQAKGWFKGAFQNPSTYRQLVPAWTLLVRNRE